MCFHFQLQLFSMDGDESTSDCLAQENNGNIKRNSVVKNKVHQFNNEEYNERTEIINSSQPMIELEHLSPAKVRWKRAQKRIRIISSFKIQHNLPSTAFKTKRHNKLKRIFWCGLLVLARPSF